MFNKLIYNIEQQLDVEKKIFDSVENYKECELTRTVRHQSTGAVRAYETVLVELKRIRQEAEDLERSML